jgi:GTPase SAR1 family protein
MKRAHLSFIRSSISKSLKHKSDKLSKSLKHKSDKLSTDNVYINAMEKEIEHSENKGIFEANIWDTMSEKEFRSLSEFYTSGGYELVVCSGGYDDDYNRILVKWKKIK